MIAQPTTGRYLPLQEEDTVDNFCEIRTGRLKYCWVAWLFNISPWTKACMRSTSSPDAKTVENHWALYCNCRDIVGSRPTSGDATTGISDWSAVDTAWTATILRMRQDILTEDIDTQIQSKKFITQNWVGNLSLWSPTLEWYCRYRIYLLLNLDSKLWGKRSQTIPVSEKVIQNYIKWQSCASDHDNIYQKTDT